MSINANFKLIGRLVADPKVQVNGRNVKTAYLTLAIDKGYKGEDGQWVDKAEFQDVVAFGDGIADTIERNYKKGTLLAVDGTIGTRKVKLENGYEQSIPALRVDKIMKLSFNQNANQRPQNDFEAEDSYADHQNNAGYGYQGGYGNIPPQ